jgi:hypothetical protein
MKDGFKGQCEEYRVLFHCWSDRYWTTVALLANEVPGQQSHPVGIVEYEDGTIHEHYPLEIQFTDGKAKEALKENSESYSQIVQQAAVTLRDELLRHGDLYEGFRASVLSVLKPKEWYIGANGCEIHAENGAHYLAEEILNRIIGEE